MNSIGPKRKFRDAQVAEDIGKRMELGWHDTEFIVYGCAYLNREDQQMYYRISNSGEDIYNFIEQSMLEDIFPSNVECYKINNAVPAGCEEYISYEIKKELARKLYSIYPKEFFQYLYTIADKIQDNRSAKQLWKIAKQNEGLFLKDELSVFKKLIDYCYSCRKLRREEYKYFLYWLADEEMNVLEDKIEKDIFSKTLYGFIYEEKGKQKQIINGYKSYINEKKHSMESEGIRVSPVYEKTYWYGSFERNLDELNKEFKAGLDDACNMNLINNLVGEMNEDNRDVLCDINQKYGDAVLRTFRRYACRWSLSGS